MYICMCTHTGAGLYILIIITNNKYTAYVHNTCMCRTAGILIHLLLIYHNRCIV